MALKVVTDDKWKDECCKLASLEIDAETEFGGRDVFRDQYLWERGSSNGQKKKLMRLWWDSTKPQLTQRETLEWELPISIVLQSAELVRSLHPTSFRVALGRAWPWLRRLFIAEGDPEGVVSPDAICWPLSQLPRQQNFSWRGIRAVSLRSTIRGWRQSSQYPFAEGLWSIC